MEYNINDLSNKIFFEKTKEYFQEVYSSYCNKNYRSAIVMLYSCVIADLLYKLIELRDYYNDEKAKNILEQIDKIRKSNPKNSEWENKLIEKVKNETNILDSYTIANIEHLKIIRNFSAHPALNQDNELIKPIKEDVEGLMIDMLIGLLDRPPIFVDNITENISEDISTKENDFLNDKEKFKKYLLKKYFERMPDSMKINVFNAFWKFTFKLENDDCNNHRDVNLLFLIIFTEENTTLIYEKIKNCQDYYNSKVSESSNLVCYLIKYLFYNKEVYMYLNEINKINIDIALKRNPEYYSIAFFKDKNVEEHIDKLNKNNIANDILRNKMEKYIKENTNCVGELNDKYIEIFSKSESYDEANELYEKLIFTNAYSYNKEQLMNYIRAVNENNQIYNRWSAKESNDKILTKISFDIAEIDFSKYKNFEFNEEKIYPLPF